jgi:hypothetical protein
MRLAKLPLAVSFVADKPRQLGALDVEQGLIALRARHVEPGAASASADSMSLVAWTPWRKTGISARSKARSRPLTTPPTSHVERPFLRGAQGARQPARAEVMVFLPPLDTQRRVRRARRVGSVRRGAAEWPAAAAASWLPQPLRGHAQWSWRSKNSGKLIRDSATSKRR